MDKLIDWLQEIFVNDLCNGDWEHRWGISITTIDNPGWYFRIDLQDTDLENLLFTEVEKEVDETNWLICRIQNQKFEGFGGPKNLSEILEIFREWYQNASRTVDERKVDLL